VINDFQSSFAFVDYKRYGEYKVFDACIVKSGKPNHSGDIGVFLNFKMVGRFKTKLQARAFIEKLIRECPAEARDFFAANQSVLLDTL
jgi:hypothetical protein